jgi:uridine kinase
VIENVVESIKVARSAGNRTAVFVCGLGGVGKSTISGRLAELLNGVVVESDWYLRHSTAERRRRIADALTSGDPSFVEAEENPQNWYDWSAFRRDIEQLRDTGNVVIDDAWAQSTGEKSDSVAIHADAGQPIICEGIYLLDAEVSDLSDVSVLLTVSGHVARERAEERDRHRSDETYLAYKRELLWKYDLPYFERHQGNADIVIDNSDLGDPKVMIVRSRLQGGGLSS